MTRLLAPSALIVAILLTGCATYESQPGYHVTATEYSHGPVTYYSTPPAYYAVPAPVYTVPQVYAAPPVYVAPAPSFNMHIQSGPSFRRSPHNHAPRQRLRSGNAAHSQVGGPGWSGTVWSR